MEDETGLRAWSLSELAARLAAHALRGAAWAAPCRRAALELGCGVEPALLRARAYAGGQAGAEPRIMVSDYSAEAIARVRAAHPSAEAVELDWSRPLPPALAAGFDLVVAAEVLYFQVELAQLLAAARELLRPGGLFLLLSFLRGTSLAQLDETARAQGLRLRLFDVHAANEAHGRPAQVEGWCVLAALQIAGDEVEERVRELGLAEHEVSVAAQVREEQEEDEAGWTAPFAD